MGRTIGEIELEMELEEIKQDLKVVRASMINKAKSIECYLFGSILTHPKLANDIDILIVYENKTHIDILKQVFKSTMKDYPLHTTYLTFYEEQELDFIKQQKAERIFSL